MKIFNIGFYGAPNFGDEILCKSNIKLFNELGADKIYICSNNKKVSKKYSEIYNENIIEGFWPKPEFFSNIVERIKILKHSDVIVIGGGGLFNDYYCKYSIMRYTIDALFGILFDKKIIFWGVGAERISYFYNRTILKFLIDTCNASVYTRDVYSKEKLKNNGIKKDAQICFDLSVGYISQNYASIHQDNNYTLVNLREDPSKDQHIIISLIKEVMGSSKCEIIFMGVEPPDKIYLDRLSKEFENSRVIIPNTLNETIDLIKGAKKIVAERLHVNLVASMMEKNISPIVYEQKVLANLEKIGYAGNYYELNSKSQKDVDFSDKYNFDIDYWIYNKNLFTHAINHSNLYSFRDKVKAVVFLKILLSYGVIYSSLITFKRLLFGRGRIW